MKQVPSKGSRPEKRLRSLLHAMGYRFRLHRKDLPGKPDIVFPSRSKIIFFHGCFWHGHDCQRGSRMPKTNADYWRQKIERNVNRDQKVRKELADRGWESMVVWECDLKDMSSLEDRIAGFLG